MKNVISLVFLVMLFLGGCARVEPRKSIIFAPVNPDVASVAGAVTRASTTTQRASTSAARAVQIVEKLVVAPGHEAELASLKLELVTTVDNLKLTTESLFDANARAGELRLQIDAMRDWGIAQQSRAERAEGNVKLERSRADSENRKAHRNGRERDVFVLLFSIAGSLAAVNFFRGFLWKLQPVLAAVAFAGIALGSFTLCFTVVRLIVGTIVTITL